MRNKEKRGKGAKEAPEDAAQEVDEVSRSGIETSVDENTEEQGEQIQAEDTTSEMEAKDQQISELSDKFIRLMAEYDNFRKRSRQEKDQLYEKSVTDVVSEWLTVVDNLERAIQVSEESDSPEVKQFIEGLELVMKQVAKTLDKLKVKEINPLGETFDPNLHSAVLHVDDDSYKPSEVIEVFQKGYERNGTVIRHAVVRVAN